MTITEFVTLAATVVGVMAVVTPILLLAMDSRLRKQFAPLHPLYDSDGNPCWVNTHSFNNGMKGLREDLHWYNENIEALKGLIVARDDRLGRVEKELELQKTEHSHQFREVVKEMERTAHNVADMAGDLRKLMRNQTRTATMLQHALRAQGVNLPPEVMDGDEP